MHWVFKTSSSSGAKPYPFNDHFPSSYFRGSYGNSPIPNGGPDGLFSAKKPPVAPSSAPTSHLYCTALGRTLSEIKAKQREELDNGSRTTAASSNGFRKQYEFARPRELSLRNGYESERSSYEQGKTHQMGSKTPEMSRKSMGGLSYQSDSEPHWRRASSAIQKASSNQVDMEGFASVRRKKTDETYSQDEQPPHRAHSVHAEWRNRQSVDSSPVPYGSLPLRRELDYLRAQRTNTPSPIQLNGDQHKNAAIRRSTSTGGETDSAVIMESMTQSEPCRSMSSVSRSTPPVPPIKPCCDCMALKEQLTRLSHRLMEMEQLESVRNEKSFQDKAEGTVVVNRSHVSVSTTSPQTSDKNVGSSRPQHLEFGTSTSPVETANSATEALCILNASKATTTSSHHDLLNAGWLRDGATSPIPSRQSHSIAMNTDETSLLSNKADHIDATTVTELDLDELLSLAHRPKSPPPQLTSTASLTQRVITMDRATDVVLELLPPERPESMDQCVGADECTVMLDAQCMTTQPSNQQATVQTEQTATRSVLVGTLAVESVHRAMETDRCTTKDCYTACEDICMATTSTQTPALEPVANTSKSLCQSVSIQTDFVAEPEPSEPRVLSDSEMAECLWLMPSRDTTDVAVGSDHDTIDDVDEKNNNHLHKATFHHTLLHQHDKDSLIEETLSDPEAIGFDESAEESPSRQQCADTDTSGDEPSPQPKALGHARAAFVKKLLTETSPHPESNFVRGTVASKSCRLDSNKGDPLQYIADQHKTQNESIPSTPQTQRGALKEKVILKKEQVVTLSKVPEPIPARIPRPKIAKYNPGEAQAQSPDEEAEVADRLTPLRSEMRTLRTYGNGRMVARSPPQSSPSPVRNTTAAYDNPAIEDDDQSSSCSSDSEGSYDTNEAKGDDSAPPFELSEPLKEALGVLQKGIDKPSSMETSTMEWATKYAQHEWLKTAARRTACAMQVEGFVDALEALSPKLLSTVVNMTDPNENTALHYAVSHGNFDVVSILLDSRICCLDRANKAGYTPVMLAALCEVNDEVESAVIHRLFQLGNVNAKAVQHGQTALMLAVSHGKMNTTRLLLQCGADLNIQDEEGSTALMCAAEHGHKEIVKLLLSQPDIDASLSDCDSSTALSIAVENGHRDIGVLIYAQLNFGRNEQSSSSHSEMTAAGAVSPSVH